MLFGSWDLSVVMAVLTYSVFSSSMLIVNKYCMIYIPAPSLISLVQLGSCSGVIIIGQCIGLLDIGCQLHLWHVYMSSVNHALRFSGKVAGHQLIWLFAYSGLY